MNIQEYNQSLNELLDKPNDFLYSEGTIQGWLANNQIYYETLKEGNHSHLSEYRYLLSIEYKYLEVYKLLIKVAKAFQNEVYFKNELSVYSSIKNNVEELNLWLKKHYLDENRKQSTFDSLFMDNRELIGYRFSTEHPVSLNINPKSFECTLKFIYIIERSKKVKIQGIVKEVFKLDNIPAVYQEDGPLKRPSYLKKNIVIESKDYNEYFIKFIQGKVQLINDIKVEDEITVYAELRGGKFNSEYQNQLFGWDIDSGSNIGQTF